MTIIQGVDYSYGRPGGAALKAAGKAFAVRYLADDKRGLTIAERDDLHANGIAIVAVFEKEAKRPLNGYSVGLIDGVQASERMLALGFPLDRPCYFAVDFDVQESQMAAVRAYFRGCMDGMGAGLTAGARRVGCYGDAQAQSCIDTRWRWAPAAKAWGDTANPTMRQFFPPEYINGAEVDLDEAYVGDYGQWLPEADMVTRAEFDAIKARLDAIQDHIERTTRTDGFDSIAAWKQRGNVGSNEAYRRLQDKVTELAREGATLADMVNAGAHAGRLPDFTVVAANLSAIAAELEKAGSPK